jgi:AbrB family looped-hinge helix DNA binding protein
MSTAVLTSKGQIVIPAAIRHSLGLEKGSSLAIEQRGDEIVMRSIDKTFFVKSAGILKTGGKLTAMVVEEHRKARKDEE